MIESILQSGIQGIQGGLDQFGRASHNVATANSDSNGINTKNLTTDLVNLKQAQLSIQSSVAVIKIADENIGTVLDELA